MTASLNASKELERKGQVWVWKREEANCLCGLLWDPGRSFEHYKESFLFQPFQPHPQSLKDFIVFHRNLPAGWGGKAGCRRGPLSSGLLWHDLWTPAPMADCDCATRSPLSLSMSPREEKLLRVMTLWQMLAKTVPCILKGRHFWPQLMNHTYLLWHMPTICS